MKALRLNISNMNAFLVTFFSPPLINFCSTCIELTLGCQISFHHCYVCLTTGIWAHKFWGPGATAPLSGGGRMGQRPGPQAELQCDTVCYSATVRYSIAFVSAPRPGPWPGWPGAWIRPCTLLQAKHAPSNLACH